MPVGNRFFNNLIRYFALVITITLGFLTIIATSSSDLSPDLSGGGGAGGGGGGGLRPPSPDMFTIDPQQSEASVVAGDSFGFGVRVINDGSLRLGIFPALSRCPENAECSVPDSGGVSVASGQSISISARIDTSLTTPTGQHNILMTFRTTGTGATSRSFNLTLTVEPAPIQQPSGIEGNSADMLYVGDLNGDLIPDIAALEIGLQSRENFSVNGSYNVSILLGRGDGTFLNPRAYNVSGRPVALRVTDVDGDYIKDIIVADSTSGSITVFIGEGDGSFANHETYPIGSELHSIAVGDIDADGIVDVITAHGTNKICTTLGQNGGTFFTPACFTTSGDPKFVVLSDLNGDNNLDILSANGPEHELLLFPGNGNATFGNPKSIATDGVPGFVSAIDLNDDNVMDLIAAIKSRNTVVVLIGTGTGTFEPDKLFTVNSIPVSISASTVDSDSTVDLIVASDTRENLEVLPGNGQTFLHDQSFAQLTNVGVSPYALVSADLNLDGITDVVTANAGTAANNISVFMGNGDGTFGSKQLLLPSN